MQQSALALRLARVQNPPPTELGGRPQGCGQAEACSMRGDTMRSIDALRILALSVALILALGCMCDTNDEETSDTDDPSSDEAAPPSEAPG